MSRSYCSYNEDWQRRKSVLIRSLFHDIPILSPVAEESNDSFQYAPTQEVIASPPRPHSPLPPLIIERVPAINKHDEPEEYYRKLHKKIKKIYLKLFVENRNLNSVDYDSDYNESSVIDDNLNDSRSVETLDLNFIESITPGKANSVSMIEGKEASERSNSTKSKGYETDYESIDTEMIDIENYTASNEEGTLRSGKEESSTDNNQSRRTSKEEESNDSSIGDQEMAESGDTNEIEEEQSNSEESLSTNLGKRKITEETGETEASKRLRKDQEDHIEEEEEESNTTNKENELTESEESNKPEDKQSYEDEKSSNKNNNKHGIVKKAVAVDDLELDQQEDSDQSITDDHESTDSEVSSATENEKRSNKTVTDLDSNEKAVKSKDSENKASENASNVETMEEDEETTSHSSEDADFRQITTEALVHIDGSQDAGEKESRVYEDSVRSIILPTRFRRVMISRNVDADEVIEVLPVLEESAGPKLVPTFYTDKSLTTDEYSEGMETPQPDAAEEDIVELGADKQDSEGSRTHQPDTAEEDIEIGTAQANACDKSIDVKNRSSQQNSADETIEEMRSHPPDLSQETILIRHRSESEPTSDHKAFPQEPTVMTSSSQDGVDRSNSEIKISNEMNDILNSIFNESRNDETSRSERKRKLYVDKSVQAVSASKVSWDEMRTNFFVGTPKIFRLCACNDHVCH